MPEKEREIVKEREGEREIVKERLSKRETLKETLKEIGCMEVLRRSTVSEGSGSVEKGERRGRDADGGADGGGAEGRAAGGEMVAKEKGVVPKTRRGQKRCGHVGGKMLKRAVVWLRRDLRVEDNLSLLAAASLADDVVPVYIYAPEEEGQFQPGRCSRWWLSCSLKSLEQDLKDLGSRLYCYRETESVRVLEGLVEKHGADGVVFNHLYDPISMVRDNEVKQVLKEKGVFCQSFNSDTLREPWDVVQPESNAPYVSFESFWAAHQQSLGVQDDPRPPAPGPASLCTPVNDNFGSLSLEELHIMTPEEEMSNAQLGMHVRGFILGGWVGGDGCRSAYIKC